METTIVYWGYIENNIGTTAAKCTLVSRRPFMRTPLNAFFTKFYIPTESLDGFATVPKLGNAASL